MPTFGTAAGHDPIWSVSGSSPVFPATGSTASVRDGLTLSALGSVTFSAGGVWAFTSGAGIDYIDLQAPSGTWVGPFMSRERQQASATFLTVANAVPLATSTPIAPGATGFAGTALTAMRGDARIPLGPAKPTAIGLTGVTVPMHPLGSPATSSLNRLNLGPIWVTTPSRAAITCTTVAVRVSTAAAAGGTVRFGMWNSNADGSINFTSLVFDSGEIVSTSTGQKTYAYTTPIPEGLYWGGMVMHTATCSYIQSTHGMFVQGGSGAGSTDDKYYRDTVSGALPTSGAVTAVGGDGAPAFFYAVA